MKMNNELNYEKTKVFLERKIKVHVVKNNGIWYNGIITEISKTKDYFFIVDEVRGKQMIFYEELNKDIEIYQEVEK